LPAGTDWYSRETIDSLLLSYGGITVAQPTTRPTRKRPLWHYIVVGFIIAIPIARFISTPPPPDLPQEAIDRAVAYMLQDPMVRDAGVVIRDDRISLAIIANRAINQQYARALGDAFVRRLAAEAATWSDDQRLKKPPTRDYFGSLWDHYTALVTIAFDADTVFEDGVLIRGGTAIRW